MGLNSLWDWLVGKRPPPPPCKPHPWKVPEVGDDGLICERCQQNLLFVNIRPTVRCNIVNAVRKHRGKVVGWTFKHAFDAAQSDAIRRWAVKNDMDWLG